LHGPAGVVRENLGVVRAELQDAWCWRRLTEIEELSTTLSQKIWQKISILERMEERGWTDATVRHDAIPQGLF